MIGILPKGGFDHGYETELTINDTQINGREVIISNFDNSIIYKFIDNTIPDNWISYDIDLKNCNRIEIQESNQLGFELINKILSTFKFK